MCSLLRQNLYVIIFQDRRMGGGGRVAGEIVLLSHWISQKKFLCGFLMVAGVITSITKCIIKYISSMTRPREMCINVELKDLV